MNDNIEKLRAIFVADDVDEETRTDNLAQIKEWEDGLRELENFSSWMEHQTTQEILARAKKTYVETSLLLARSRELTEAARFCLWAKQDAMMWFIALASTDVEQEKKTIEMRIQLALNSA